MWSTLAVGLALATVIACAPAPTAPNQPAASSPTAPSPTAPAVVTTTPTPEATESCAEPCRRSPRTVGSFGARVAPEASGLAAGVRNPTLLYLVDDGPGTTSVVAITAATGRVAGTLEIAGLDGVDTEDLAVGPCPDALTTPCIYIADIGDNTRTRDSIAVVIVPEPDLSTSFPTAPMPARTVVLRYPNGPQDSEALLVGADATIGIITKEAGRDGRGGAVVYTGDAVSGVLRRAGRLRLPAPWMPAASMVLGNVVTAADATPGRVVVRTYDALYELTADRPDAPLRSLPSWSVRQLRAPTEPQGEAVAYAADGCGLYTVSEDSPDLTSIPCR